ncbi:uncharacterized protein METZ01_LOCUS493412 [marine metagenome]|uniref:Uncharacterized protein n=1 Tax=marine metagenome TaxID=408172 RepID=A0A383D9M5_9ZZZZ
MIFNHFYMVLERQPNKSVNTTAIY